MISVGRCIFSAEGQGYFSPIAACIQMGIKWIDKSDIKMAYPWPCETSSPSLSSDTLGMTIPRTFNQHNRQAVSIPYSTFLTVQSPSLTLFLYLYLRYIFIILYWVHFLIIFVFLSFAISYCCHIVEREPASKHFLGQYIPCGSSTYDWYNLKRPVSVLYSTCARGHSCITVCRFLYTMWLGSMRIINGNVSMQTDVRCPIGVIVMYRTGFADVLPMSKVNSLDVPQPQLIFSHNFPWEIHLHLNSHIICMTGIHNSCLNGSH